MYIQRSVQSDKFALRNSLKRRESFNHDNSESTLPDFSNNQKPTGNDNGVTMGIVRFCIVLGGILLVIIITGIVIYIYRKKFIKLKSRPKKPPKTNTISYILDYYEHDYIEPEKKNNITMRINKSNISEPTSSEEVQPITTSQISAPMPNSSVSIYNKERANSLASNLATRSVDATTITPPVPARTSANDGKLKTTSRESEKLKTTSRDSKKLKTTSRESEKLKTTSRESEKLKATSRDSEKLKAISRDSEIERFSNATSLDNINIIPDMFDDSTENAAAPIDINTKWFTYPIDSPTIPLTPSFNVPKTPSENSRPPSEESDSIAKIPEVNRKSKRNLRIRIDTFDQFKLAEDRTTHATVGTSTHDDNLESKSKVKEGKQGEDNHEDENKRDKVDLSKMALDEKSRSFRVPVKNNQHKRNGSIFEYKLIRSKTIN